MSELGDLPEAFELERQRVIAQLEHDYPDTGRRNFLRRLATRTAAALAALFALPGRRQPP